jgi:hypothetical protein
MYFSTVLSKVLFVGGSAGLLIGVFVLLFNAIFRRDKCDQFVPWFARIGIYGVLYAILAPVGFLYGGYLCFSDSAAKRKFGLASLYVCALYMMQSASFWAGARIR